MMRVSCSMSVSSVAAISMGSAARRRRKLFDAELGARARSVREADRLDRRGGLDSARASASISSAAVTVISASPSARPVAIRVSSAVALRSVPSSPRAASRSSRRAPSSTQAASSSAAARAGGRSSARAPARAPPRPARGPRSGRSDSSADQRRGAHRQRGADRAVALEHRAQSQKVVAEALQRALALAAHLEAADRPGEGAVGVGAGLEGRSRTRPARSPPPR